MPPTRVLLHLFYEFPSHKFGPSGDYSAELIGKDVGAGGRGGDKEKGRQGDKENAPEAVADGSHGCDP